MIIVIIGFIGLLMGGIPGMFLGIFIGVVLSKIDFKYIRENEFGDSVLLRTIPILSAWIVIGAGNSKSAVLNIKQFAINTFGTDRAKIFMDSFKSHILNGISYEKLRVATNEINSSMNITNKYSILQFLISVISNRNDFKDSDLNGLKDIAELLGININFEKSGKYQQYSKNSIQDKISPYKVLEVNESDPFENIKKQYRKLSMQYHPDRNSNLSDDERIVSEVKMREINDAYNKIKMERNIK